MQRNVPEGIIIACDFCGQDWDEIRPMIEGHRGSVLCLDCLKFALAMAHPAKDAGPCTMCLHPIEDGKIMWQHPDRPESANQQALICEGCIKQAAGTFSKDADIPWKWDRKIAGKEPKADADE